MIKLSILIPCFNYKLGLNKIINNILSCEINDLYNIEVIIADDSEKKLLNKKEIDILKKEIPNFKYIHNKINKGAAFNWNKLIDLAQGDYYWIIHHDECIADPKNLIKEIKKYMINKNKLIILPIYKYQQFILKGFIIQLIIKHTSEINMLKKFIRFPQRILDLNIIGPPSALILKNSIKIKYRSDLIWLIDVDYYSRIISSLNPHEIKILTDKKFIMLSNQNYKYSISKKIEGKKRRKLKFEEYKKINFKKFNSFNLFFHYLTYKFFSLKTINIKFLSLGQYKKVKRKNGNI